MTAGKGTMRYHSGGKRKPYCPSPEQLYEMRRDADLDIYEASALIHYSYQAWKMFESGDRAMHPALWELFQIKARKRIRQRAVEAKQAQSEANRARLDLLPPV